MKYHDSSLKKDGNGIVDSLLFPSYVYKWMLTFFLKVQGGFSWDRCLLHQLF